MSFVAAAVIGGVASLAGGLLSSNAASQAANAQSNAAILGAQTQGAIYGNQVANLAPFRTAGGTAANAITAGAGTGGLTDVTAGIGPQDWQQFLNPALAGMMGYGGQAVQNMSNLNNGVFSGNTLKAISDYMGTTYLNQGFLPAVNAAFQNKQNVQSNLYNVANLGSTAAGAGATGSPTFASGIASGLTGAGAAQAGGIVGQANALTGAASNASSWYTLPQMARMFSGSGGGVFNPVLSSSGTSNDIYGIG